MVTHSSSLAWRIPWTEKSDWLPWGCRVGHDWAVKRTRAHTHIHNYAGSLSPWPLTSLSLRCTFCLGLLLSLFIHSLGSFLLCPPQNPHTRKVSIFITPCWQVPVITSLPETTNNSIVNQVYSNILKKTIQTEKSGTEAKERFLVWYLLSPSFGQDRSEEDSWCVLTGVLAVIWWPTQWAAIPSLIFRANTQDLFTFQGSGPSRLKE